MKIQMDLDNVAEKLFRYSKNEPHGQVFANRAEFCFAC